MQGIQFSRRTPVEPRGSQDPGWRDRAAREGGERQGFHYELLCQVKRKGSGPSSEDDLAGCLDGSSSENFKSTCLSLILPQDCGRGTKEWRKKVRSQGEGAFCFKGLPLGSVPNFLGFVSDLKRRGFMSPLRVCIFVGFKYFLIRCCLFTERKDAFYFILLCRFNLLPFCLITR